MKNMFCIFARKFCKNFYLFVFFLIFYAGGLSAQIEGDNLFKQDQIISIELNFSQIGFWDSLQLNYASSSYMKADLILTDSTGTYNFSDVGVRLKGNSSYGHPGNKKSFKIDFNKYISGQNYDGLKKLNFSNGFKDPSLIREKIFFDLCQAAGVAAPRANFANVYFNGTLWGFYTLIEQIDDQFLDWRILDDDGNLFKAGANFGDGPDGGGNAADLQYYGSNQESYEERYDLKSNEAENDWTDLINFIDFINNSTPTEFENKLSEHLELEEYLRSAALDNLFSNLDSYTNSARNFYLYHNLTSGKWEWIKWDANEAFGTYRGGPGLNDLTRLPIDYHAIERPLLENVMNSETLLNLYKVELCNLMDEHFNSEYLDPRIEKIKTLVQTSVYADNNKMYTNANFDNNIENDITIGGGPMGGTVYGLKSFVQERFNYVSGILDCSIISAVHKPEVEEISIYPNPVQSTLSIKWESPRLDLIKIYNGIGQKVYHESIFGRTKFEIDVSLLEEGMYFIEIGEKLVRPFIVLKN